VAKPVSRKPNHRDGQTEVRGSKISSPEAGTVNPRERFWNRVLFGTVLVWTFLATCFPMFDTDFWWHLKTGEWILQNGTTPAVDLYTFTDSDKPWIDLHWGFQILIALLYRAGGVPLVSLVKSAITTVAVAIGWHAAGNRLPGWKKLLIWIFPLICITGRANERPEMLSMLFLAVWLWVAVHSDVRPRLIWVLPAVQLIWVNCHALFVLGLVVGFCYAVDALARDALAGRFGLAPHTSGPDFRTVWIAGGFVAVACFLNPYFEEGAFFPLVLYRKFSTEKAFYSINIAEFQPPIDFVLRYGLWSFRNIYLIAEIGTWLIAAYSFWLFAVKRHRWSLFRALLFVGFSHLAWQASRNTNIFALVSAFVACENFSDAHSTVEAERSEPSVSSEIRRTKILVGLMAGMCVIVVSGVWNEVGEKNKPFGLGEAPNWFIHDAARFAGQPGFPEWAFVANNGQAEVYIYHNGPERKVFMDARLEVCTQDTFKVYNDVLMRMAHADPRWMGLFKETMLPVVILDSRTSREPINGMLQTPDWRLVFADRTAAVFLPDSTADKLKLPPVQPTPLLYPDGPPKSTK
jgi:hypothetical protein